MRNLKLLLLTALLLTTVGVFAQDDQENVTIIHSQDSRAMGAVLPIHVENFNDLQDAITVEWENISGVPDEQRNLYVTRFTAGSSTPDVLAVDIILVGDYAARGWLEPLNQYFDEGELEGFLGDFADAATVDGQLYAMPMYVDGIHLYYRTDLLEKYDFEPPETWEELIMQANTILEGEDDPNLTGFTSMWADIEGLFMNWLGFFWGAGGQFFDEEGNVAINNEAGLTAMQTMVDMLYEHEIASDSILTYRPDDARILFQQGRAVFLMVQDFVWQPLTSEDSPVADVVDFKRVPYFEGFEDTNTTPLGGWLLAINANSDHKEEAAEWIGYVTSAEAQLTTAIEQGRLPTRVSVYDDPALDENFPVAADQGANYEVGNVRPSAQTGALYPQVSDIMQTEVTEALFQRKSPEEALADAEERINEVLND